VVSHSGDVSLSVVSYVWCDWFSRAGGAVSVWLIKHFKLHTFNGETITFKAKDKTYWRYILGGIIFGLGWAMTGACPGPVAALIGAGQVFL
jgi:hypothetical protein